MPSFKAIVLSLVVMLAVGLDADGVVEERFKRSDDVAAPLSVVENLSRQVVQLTADLESVKAKIKASQRSVMFHAYSAKAVFNIAAAGTVVYDSVTTNVGNAYDTLTGFFTAPVSGEYAFFVNCMANENAEETVGIVLEGDNLAMCYSNRTEGHQSSESGTTMAALKLLSGARVWVKSYRYEAQDIASGLWNTFSGFLVHPDQ